MDNTHGGKRRTHLGPRTVRADEKNSCLMHALTVAEERRGFGNKKEEARGRRSARREWVDGGQRLFIGGQRKPRVFGIPGTRD